MFRSTQKMPRNAGRAHPAAVDNLNRGTRTPAAASVHHAIPAMISGMITSTTTGFMPIAAAKSPRSRSCVARRPPHPGHQCPVTARIGQSGKNPCRYGFANAVYTAPAASTEDTAMGPASRCFSTLLAAANCGESTAATGELLGVERGDVKDEDEGDPNRSENRTDDAQDEADLSQVAIGC